MYGQQITNVGEAVFVKHVKFCYLEWNHIKYCAAVDQTQRF